jgi:hypothetical protein
MKKMCGMGRAARSIGPNPHGVNNGNDASNASIRPLSTATLTA